MKETRLVTIFFFALLLLLLYFAYLIVGPFLRAIAWAAILAIVVYPAHTRLVRLLKGRATVSALILMLIILLIVLLPSFRLIGFLADEAIEFSKLARAFVEEDGIKAWQGNPWVMELMRRGVKSALGSFVVLLRSCVPLGICFKAGPKRSYVRRTPTFKNWRELIPLGHLAAHCRGGIPREMLGSPSKVTAARRDFVLRALEGGQRPSQIAAFLGCSPSTVSKIVSRNPYANVLERLHVDRSHNLPFPSLNPGTVSGDTRTRCWSVTSAISPDIVQTGDRSSPGTHPPPGPGR